ncbi:carbonic anhydrase [Nannochloropsis gaditana]|uniref:Carbonic anhydrase n=1 Tax=Nannochloropsis gaditana TaxID=72520 RepID=W7TZZ4_9STRA|nr:carbonic anhydrase [Nannochloropsis gaditana]
MTGSVGTSVKPSISQQNHEVLERIRHHLDDQEHKIHEQLNRFQLIKKAVERICKNDDAYMQSPDIVKAQTTLEDSPLERKGNTAAEALELLKAGNAAFLRDEVPAKQCSDRHIGLHFAQKPHAIIIACSDSRVPPEMIFNCAFGELFVIRLAGNTIDALARASLLYAVQHLHSPLVVVLGHEKCGAVTAALQPPEALAEAPRDIKTLVKKIQSGIECALLEPGLEDVDDERLLCAIVCNVHSVARTLSEHPDIRPFIEQKALSVVGAYYAFNGVVSFFDDGEDGNATGKEVGSTVNGQASLCMSCSGTIHRSSSPTADPSQKVNSRLSVSEGLSKNT